MKRFDLCASMMCADFGNLRQEVKELEAAGIDSFHIDIMDGRYVNNFAMSLYYMACIADSTELPLDVHLMIEHPRNNIDIFLDRLRPGDTVYIHPEAEYHPSATLQKIIDADMPFRRTEATLEEAVRVFTERGFTDKVKLLETSGQVYTYYYTLGDTVDYYYGPLVPSAGYLKVWGLERYQDGLLLRMPDKQNPLMLAEKVSQPRTFEVFAEKVRWDVIMHLSNAGDVNKAILHGYASELIQVSEALQEKKIVQIAEEIDRRFHREQDPIRLVLITGPSSSGKSTFCKRLSVQLLA